MQPPVTAQRPRLTSASGAASDGAGARLSATQSPARALRPGGSGRLCARRSPQCRFPFARTASSSDEIPSLTVLVGAMLLFGSERALAVPSFARQTGFECTACHLSWPELTSVGRQFKLGGYTLMREAKGERPWLPTSNDGPPPKLPLAAMVQGSVTEYARNIRRRPCRFSRATTTSSCSSFRRSMPGGSSTISAPSCSGPTTGSRTTVRSTTSTSALAGHFEGDGLDLSYGLTVNNNPDRFGHLQHHVRRGAFRTRRRVLPSPRMRRP